ncbi:MAG: hypothetical protein ACFFBD_26925 [Candidatus Hodarchaeota archaeon]
MDSSCCHVYHLVIEFPTHLELLENRTVHIGIKYRKPEVDLIYSEETNVIVTKSPEPDARLFQDIEDYIRWDLGNVSLLGT